MITRCTNPNTKYYQYYGGNGVTVYAPWQTDFSAFLTHVGLKPDPTMSIDRIDHEKGYEPGNVHWASKREQALNRRTPSTNTSGFRGVSYDKKRNRYESRIKGGRDYLLNLGIFIDAEQAALAYDAAAVQLNGDLARTNFL